MPNYSAVLFKEIYPGIDLRYSGEGNGKAAYEFVAVAGADLGQVRVEYEGVEELTVDENARMVAKTAWGNMAAIVASPAEGARPDSPRLTPLAGSTPGFAVTGEAIQQAASVAVTLDYSTFLGGASDDRGYGIAVDGSGCAYVTGRTGSSNFPTQNAYHASYNGNYDCYVTKFSSSGGALIYSTYLGGGDEDVAFGIAVDGSGNACVTGYTTSPDFPTENPFQATLKSGRDAFVTKLSASGNSLIYSTYLGGGEVDDGHDIGVDSSGNVYVTGWTYSSDFPTQNPYQVDQGDWDVFVTKLSSFGNSLIYSSYLGGGGRDEGSGIAVDGSGNAYVTGQTTSSDFPTQNPYDASHNGAHDVFVTKLSNAGNSLIYSTYLGGGSSDEGYVVSVDDSGNAYVTGYTYSADFPTQNPYQSDGSRRYGRICDQAFQFRQQPNLQHLSRRGKLGLRRRHRGRW